MEVEYKGYKIMGDGTFGMKLIKRIGSGSLPKILSGSFTGFGPAKQAIDSSFLVKERKDAKTISSD